jgi:transposase
VILIPSDDRKIRKTDRRDAADLSELLRVDRDRPMNGKPVRGLLQVDIPTDQKDRRVTILRKDAGRDLMRVINKVRQILRRHNLQWEMPTKTFPTVAAVALLKKIVLPERQPRSPARPPRYSAVLFARVLWKQFELPQANLNPNRRL